MDTLPYADTGEMMHYVYAAYVVAAMILGAAIAVSIYRLRQVKMRLRQVQGDHET